MIQIIESTPEMIKLKMPFTTVPIEMNHDFFKRQWQQGYFQLPEDQGYTIAVEQPQTAEDDTFTETS